MGIDKAFDVLPMSNGHLGRTSPLLTNKAAYHKMNGAYRDVENESASGEEEIWYSLMCI